MSLHPRLIEATSQKHDFALHDGFAMISPNMREKWNLATITVFLDNTDASLTPATIETLMPTWMGKLETSCLWRPRQELLRHCVHIATPCCFKLSTTSARPDYGQAWRRIALKTEWWTFALANVTKFNEKRNWQIRACRVIKYSLVGKPVTWSM